MPSTSSSSYRPSRPAPAQSTASGTNDAGGTSSMFRAPTFIRTIFDKFPLYSYPVDPSPINSLDKTPSEQPHDDLFSKNTLYVFSLPGDAQNCSPSFNPACLKWQIYMKIRGVDFRIQSSSNHASPTGSLPFLIVEPARSSVVSGRQLAQTVPASKLAQWIEDNAAGSVNQVSSDSPDYRAFSSLVDRNIRDAWLYAMYVDNTNLNNITVPKYTNSTPLWPVNYLLGLQMRQAALDSLGVNGVGSKVNGEMLYMRANEAWAALSALLGDNKWFFSARDAGLFDASVFAYTHLILTLGLERSGEDLVNGLQQYSNLIDHEQRIRNKWCT
ncbi:hypothetical protein TWF694_004862 [Orbilia ellipsospora]|uniref:Mitochondrial outer membrane protein n=1 Tax=Orbilia ellipsospora TaxID=2528407 RepID=A0AAV9WUZ0_9PEZI